MKRITFKSLFSVSKKVQNDLNYYFSNLDFELIKKYNELKNFLNKIEYVEHNRFRKMTKIINNLLLVYDFSKLKNYNIDLLTLITKDYSINKEQFNGIDKKIDYLLWFNDWINFTKLDLSSFESSKLFIKYIRKELNNSRFVRNYRDTDYSDLLDDIFLFLNSDELDHFPFIKIAIIIKQFFYLTPILSIEVLFTIFNFLLKKYNLDLNLSSPLFISFLLDNESDYSTKIDEIQKMNLHEFCELIKLTLIKTATFSIEIYNDIYNLISEIDSSTNIDDIYDKEFKNLISSELIIDFPKLYLYEIYFTRFLYNQKINDFITKGFIEDIGTKWSSTLINKKILDLIYLIEYKKSKFRLYQLEENAID